MLVLAKADPATKERGGKECSIRANGTRGSKMNLTLLAKVVALHVEFSMVEVRESGFERTLSRAWFQATCLRLEEQVHAEFFDSLEVFLGVSGGSQSKDWSIWGWGIRRSHITWCRSPFFWACGLLWLTGTNRAWCNVLLRARASCHICGVGSFIV